MTVSLFRSLRALADPASASRRDVLKAVGVAVSGLFLHEHLPAAHTPPSRRDAKRVLVIGAGFAGLACADELVYAGYRVTVVEARKRVGGRVETRDNLVRGKVVEAGGELVGPNRTKKVSGTFSDLKRFLTPFSSSPFSFFPFSPPIRCACRA